jgi:hypothetical protein
MYTISTCLILLLSAAIVPVCIDFFAGRDKLNEKLSTERGRIELLLLSLIPVVIMWHLIYIAYCLGNIKVSYS